MRERKNFSCIIPAYNEEGRVGRVIKAVKNYPSIEEIIVVSDGSTDKTADEAQLAGADKVIKLEKNLGKGGAVFIGAKEAKSDFLLLLDADLVNLNYDHLDQLIKPIRDNVADMTIGVLADDRNQKLFPVLSGQRALKKELILNYPQIKNSRFQLELLLNQLAKENNYRVIFVDLVNLGHIKKRSKYRFWMAINKYIDSFFSFIIFYFKKLWLPLSLIFLIYLNFYPFKKTFSDLGLIPSPTINDRILVIVAHPDDETIGLGGYLAQATKNGAKVKIVIVTNGEGNKFYAYLGEKKFFSKEKFIHEEKVRINEALLAINALNISPENVVFLGFPDRWLNKLLNENWDREYFSPLTKQNKSLFENDYNFNSKYSGEDLDKILRKIIFDFRPTKIFTHSSFDKHPDHQAVNRFVGIALRETYFPSKNIYTFLVHYHYFSKPWQISKNRYLLPPSDLQNLRWLTFPLSAEIIDLKEKAIKEYKSQLESPYLNLLLKSFIRKNELFHQGLD